MIIILHLMRARFVRSGREGAVVGPNPTPRPIPSLSSFFIGSRQIERHAGMLYRERAVEGLRARCRRNSAAPGHGSRPGRSVWLVSTAPGDLFTDRRSDPAWRHD